MLRWIGRLLALAVTLLVVVTAATGILLWASLPKHEGDRRLPGLGDRVIVERDALGVPTINAATRLDLARATGYVHAQERFFQMDLARRGGAGEVAALVGKAALPFDRRRAIYRFRARARDRMLDLPQAQQDLLYAYADGVNAGLADLNAQPFEYLLLRAAPEPWTAEDSLLVAASMYFMLTDERAERALRLERLEAATPPALHRYLVPETTPWDAPLLGEPGALPEPPAADAYDLRAMPPAWFEGTPAAIRHLAGLGSNSLAVSGGHTADGRALVAGDMHLDLGVPNTWFRARMRVPADDAETGLDLNGVTLPGLPFLIAGSNGRVAWAFTNSYGVWSERIRLRRDGQGNVLGPEGPVPVTDHQHRITVAGGGTHTVTVRETPWGPVLPGDDAGPAHALRWLPLVPGVLNLDIMAMERAEGIEDALAALNGAGIPPQSALIASRDGRIAWTIAGRMPRRAGPAPQRPVPSTAPRPWQGWLDDDAYPRIVDPPGGRLVAANARLVDGEALAMIGDGGYAFGARQQRLRELVNDADAPVAPADALAMQGDVRSRYLDAWAAVLRAALDDPAAASHAWAPEVRAALDGWEARAVVDDPLYRLVRLWHDATHNRVMHALTAPVRAEHPGFAMHGFPVAQAAVLDLARRQPPHLLDPRHDSWPAFLLAVMDGVITADAETGSVDWRARSWGDSNRLAMRHPLSGALPGLHRLLDMPERALSGDSDVPRVQGPGFGASQRMVITPGDEASSLFHMPGGQSGHPLSAHYRDGHRAWVEVAETPLLPGEPVARLTLRP